MFIVEFAKAHPLECASGAFVVVQASLAVACAKLPAGSKAAKFCNWLHATLPLAFAHMFPSAAPLVAADEKKLAPVLSIVKGDASIDPQ